MKIRFRRLRKSEQDYEFLLGVLFAPLFVLATALITQFPHFFNPHCEFHALTGLPCPTCGSFRTAQLLLRGNIADAWLMQPLITLLAGLGLTYMLYAWIVTGLRLPRIRFENVSRRMRILTFLAFIIVGLINWAYLIVSRR